MFMNITSLNLDLWYWNQGKPMEWIQREREKRLREEGLKVQISWIQRECDRLWYRGWKIQISTVRFKPLRSIFLFLNLKFWGKEEKPHFQSYVFSLCSTEEYEPWSEWIQIQASCKFGLLNVKNEKKSWRVFEFRRCFLVYDEQ